MPGLTKWQPESCCQTASLINNKLLLAELQASSLMTFKAS